MEITAQVIADHLKGEIVGNPQTKVSKVARIENGKPGSICFLANMKYEHYIYTTKASIVLVNNSFEPKEHISATLIKVEDAYSGIASLLGLLNKLKAGQKKGHSWRASISRSAKIGKHTYIGPHAYIGKRVKIGKNCQIYPQVFLGDNVIIGDNVILYPGVKIYYECEIGNNCILHANSVIGADGFGFAPQEDGSYKKIPQTGKVVLEDDVEIGANTCIDRSTMDETRIEKGVKLDNLIQIAHNVSIGKNTVIASLTGIAGSAKVGERCMIGGQTGINGHIKIGDDVKIGARSGVFKGITDTTQVYQGTPAIPARDYFKAYVLFKNAPKKNKNK